MLHQSSGSRLFTIVSAIATGLAVLLSGGLAVAGPMALEKIRQRGHVLCGVGEKLGGLSRINADGTWSGLEVDFCSALAAAVLGDKSAIRFRAVNASDRFKALQEGDIDVLMRGTALTFSREAELGIRFAGVLLHDGQGFLVRRTVAVASTLELSGATICVHNGTGAAQGIEDYFKARQMRFKLLESSKWEDLVVSYAGGHCTLLTGDVSTLALERSRLADPDAHVVLPELITHEPLGPMVRQGDDAWFTVVRWTLMALFEAEELGLSSRNIDDNRESGNHEVRRFLGLEATLGQALGLPPDWTYQVVKQVGHYGELFDRNLGEHSPFKLARGLNDLWGRGGIMLAAPFR